MRAIAYGSSQAVLLDTSIILFLVLRRSMLHALGFTYPEIVPLHRWLGVTMLVWATVHAAFYSAWLTMEGKFWTDIAFSDKSRGTRNMPGVFAWVSHSIQFFVTLDVIIICYLLTFVYLFAFLCEYVRVDNKRERERVCVCVCVSERESEKQWHS